MQTASVRQMSGTLRPWNQRLQLEVFKAFKHIFSLGGKKKVVTGLSFDHPELLPSLPVRRRASLFFFLSQNANAQLWLPEKTR